MQLPDLETLGTGSTVISGQLLLEPEALLLQKNRATRYVI